MGLGMQALLGPENDPARAIDDDDRGRHGAGNDDQRGEQVEAQPGVELIQGFCDVQIADGFLPMPDRGQQGHFRCIDELAGWQQRGRESGHDHGGIHRVIGKDGNLRGYGGKVWRKKKLLDIETNGINKNKI